MLCPSCNNQGSEVIDSRPQDGGRLIRRRRQCINCKNRFTTYESSSVSFDGDQHSKHSKKDVYSELKRIHGENYQSEDD